MRVCRSRTKLVRHVGVALIRCLLTDHCWFVVPGARMRKTVVVFYVGGVTYLEVAAYRHLSEKRTYSALSQSGSCGPERFVVSYSAHRLHHRHYQGCEWLDLAPVTDQPNRQPAHVRASCTNICCVSDQCRCQPWRCEWQWARRWTRRRVACPAQPSSPQLGLAQLPRLGPAQPPSPQLGLVQLPRLGSAPTRTQLCAKLF